MVDTRTPEQRSRIMASVRSTDTKPELVVRGLAHRMGYRFRLHSRDLPGKPDLVFLKRRKVIFVHGCYWHGHGCNWGKLPKSNLGFWGPKIARNRERDAATVSELDTLGWGILIVWQCETRNEAELKHILRGFLGRSPSEGQLR